MDLLSKDADISSIHKLTNKYKHDGVLFFELGEKGEDPSFGIPGYISLSSTAFDGTKTFQKAGFPYFLIEPPTDKDITEMGVYIHRHMGSASIFKDLLPEDKKANEEDDQVREIIRVRINLVGPVPRIVLAPLTSFETALVDIVSNAGSVFEEFRRASIDRIADKAKYFIAPVIQSYVKTPLISGGADVSIYDESQSPKEVRVKPIWRWRFLITYLSYLIGES